MVNHLNLHHTHGFSLIDLLIALSVFATGLASVMGLLVQNRNQLRNIELLARSALDAASVATALDKSEPERMIPSEQFHNRLSWKTGSAIQTESKQNPTEAYAFGKIVEITIFHDSSFFRSYQAIEPITGTEEGTTRQ
ncbi:hypothetical protein JXA80_14690 [bacterium]|nr:hypothetical protein [candidate division CSSED10-310 bacterium]